MNLYPHHTPEKATHAKIVQNCRKFITSATTETLRNIYAASPTEIQVQKQSIEQHPRDVATFRSLNSWETPKPLYFVKTVFQI